MKTFINILTAITLAYVPFPVFGDDALELQQNDGRSQVSSFYKLQDLEEELKSIRSDVDDMRRDITELKQIRTLVTDLSGAINQLEAKLTIEDDSGSELATVLRDFNLKLSELESRVTLLDGDLRKKLDILVNTLSSEIERSAETSANNLATPSIIESPKNDTDGVEGAPSLSNVQEATAYYKYAKELYDAGNFAAAKDLFDRLYAKYPEELSSKTGRYWSARAQIAMTSVQSQEAVNILLELLPRLYSDKHNKQCETVLLLGTTYMERDSKDAAKKYLEEALSICMSENDKLNSDRAKSRLRELERR